VEDVMARSGQRAPSVGYGGRISIEADQLRRRLEAQLGISGSKVLELALQALDRELQRAEQSAR
jgi:hypothetical protein